MFNYRLTYDHMIVGILAFLLGHDSGSNKVS